ncbi:MAG TPA: serine hydrolase domain-containing protein [Candidatus Limnocylindrales bacterium]
MTRAILAATALGALVLGLLGVLAVGGNLAGTATPVASPTASASPSATPSEASSPAPARPTPRPAPTPDVRVLLTRRLEQLRVEHAIPAVSAAVILPDGTTWTGASGLADVVAKRRATPDTEFAIASISKTFVAALILQLSAEGRIGLSDAASDYLPDQKGLEGITIRMLLNHTSGLHDYFLNPKIDRALRSEPSRGWSPTRTLGYVGKPYFAPGTGWHYSNTNYLLLGLIAERLDRRPLAVQLRTRFFDPLKLDGAYYQVAERPRGPTAHGYRFDGVGKRRPPIDLSDNTGIMPFKSVVTAAGGAGSVAATARDVARWARALYGGEVLDGSELALMLSGVEPSEDYPVGVPYGMGVQVIDIEGHRTYGHSGRLLGFRGVVRHVPANDVTIAVLTNQSRVDAGVLARDLLLVVLPPPGACELCPVPS